MNFAFRVVVVMTAALMLLTSPLATSAQAPAKGKRTCITKPAVHRVTSSFTGPVITFGIQGGNIRPWSVTFEGDGTVTSTGWVKPNNTHLAEPTSALNGTLTLASAEGFYSMPGFTNCAGTLPDIATRYITITGGTSTKEVKVHGGCVRGFNELFAVLENVADFQH